jgi:hypothetical protein
MMNEGLFQLMPEDPAVQGVPWQSVSGSLKAAIEENLEPFSPTVMDEYEGLDLPSIRNFEMSLGQDFVDPHHRKSYGAPPSMDSDEMKKISQLQGTVIKGTVTCFQAEKLEKISIVTLELVKKYYGVIFTVWPAEEYVLPILSISMDESPDATHFFADCVPLADCVMDSDYLEQYLDPFEPVWKKYKFIRDLPNFPDYEVNLYSWMRSMSSPFMITRRVPPNKPKGIRDDLISMGIEYLRTYIAVWEKAGQHDKDYMDIINARRKRIRQLYRTGKDPAGNFWWKGERYLGAQLTQSLITASY